MKNVIFQRKGLSLLLNFKKVFSGLMCLVILFSSSIDFFAYTSVNNNDSSKVYNDKLSDSFVEHVKPYGNTVKYDDSNNLLYLNGEKVTSLTETPSDNPILKKLNKSVSNSWSLTNTQKLLGRLKVLQRLV